MKNIVSLMMALCCSIGVGWAQLGSPVFNQLQYRGSSRVLARVGSSRSPIRAGLLDGQTTYRLYMNMLNETDYMSSCSGDSENQP